MNYCISLKGSKEDFAPTKDTSAEKRWIDCTKNTQKGNTHQDNSEFHQNLEQASNFTVMALRFYRKSTVFNNEVLLVFKYATLSVADGTDFIGISFLFGYFFCL